MLCKLLIFYVISTDAVFRNNVSERWRQWSQKMIAELNIRPFQAILRDYSGFSWLKTVDEEYISQVCNNNNNNNKKRYTDTLLNLNSCLHSLLPTPRDPNLVTRLRAARRFPALASRTKQYQSFINFGLLNYQ